MILAGLAALAASVWFGFVRIPPPCHDCTEKVWDEFRHTAQREGINLCRLRHDAMRGDEEAIRQLFMIPSSGASAYGHGIVLVEVLQSVGDRRFAEISATAPPGRREVSWHKIECGVEYGGFGDPDQTTKYFPRTARTLVPDGCTICGPSE